MEKSKKLIEIAETDTKGDNYSRNSLLSKGNEINEILLGI